MFNGYYDEDKMLEKVEQRVIKAYGQKIAEYVKKEVAEQIEKREFEIYKKFLKEKMEETKVNKKGK